MTGASTFRGIAMTAGIVSGLMLSGGSAKADTDLILCNKTGSKIQIAVAYQHAQTGRWMMSAWHNRNPGECKSFATIKTGLFYYHAKNEKNSVWPSKENSERSYCVPSEVVTRDMSTPCGKGEANRDFRGRTTQPGKYTFSFS